MPKKISKYGSELERWKRINARTTRGERREGQWHGKKGEKERRETKREDFEDNEYGTRFFLRFLAPVLC